MTVTIEMVGRARRTQQTKLDERVLARHVGLKADLQVSLIAGSGQEFGTVI